MLPVPPKSILPSLFNSIHASTKKLLFIKYTLEGMMRARWYLITVDLNITESLDLKPEQTGMYDVAFITCHPDDK